MKNPTLNDIETMFDSLVQRSACDPRASSYTTRLAGLKGERKYSIVFAVSKGKGRNGGRVQLQALTKTTVNCQRNHNRNVKGMKSITMVGDKKYMYL